MFDLFNESSVLPQGVVEIEIKIARQISESKEVEDLLKINKEIFPKNAEGYTLLIGDRVYELARNLSEKYGDDLDRVSSKIKFSAWFEKPVEDRSIPITRADVEEKGISAKTKQLLWEHDLKLLKIIIQELQGITILATNK